MSMIQIISTRRVNDKIFNRPFSTSVRTHHFPSDDFRNAIRRKHLKH